MEVPGYGETRFALNPQGFQDFGAGAFEAAVLVAGGGVTQAGDPLRIPVRWRAFQVTGEPPPMKCNLPMDQQFRVPLSSWGLGTAGQTSEYNLQRIQDLRGVDAALIWEGGAPFLEFNRKGPTPGGTGKLEVLVSPAGSTLTPRRTELAYAVDPTEPRLTSDIRRSWRARKDRLFLEVPMHWEHYEPLDLRVTLLELTNQKDPRSRWIEGWTSGWSAGCRSRRSRRSNTVLRFEVAVPDRSISGIYQASSK